MTGKCDSDVYDEGALSFRPFSENRKEVVTDRLALRGFIYVGMSLSGCSRTYCIG